MKVARASLIAVLLLSTAPGQAVPRPLRDLLESLHSPNVNDQLASARELQTRKLLQATGVQAAMETAIEADSAERWKFSGHASDAFTDRYVDLINIYRSGYGLKPVEVARAILSSGAYQPESELGYALARMGAELYPAAIALFRHNPQPANRPEVLGVLAEMLRLDELGEAPALSAAQRSEILAAVRSALMDSSGGLSYIAIPYAAETHDPGLIMPLENLAANSHDLRPVGTRALAYEAIAVIRFVHDPPMDGPGLSRTLGMLASADWRAEATALYSLGSGCCDTFYGIRLQPILSEFPTRASEIRTSLNTALKRETKRLDGSPALQSDGVYRAFYDNLASTVGQEDDPAVLPLLVGTLRWCVSGPFWVGRFGDASAKALLPLATGTDPGLRRAAILALCEMPLTKAWNGPQGPGLESRAGIRALGRTLLSASDPQDRISGIQLLQAVEATESLDAIERLAQTDTDSRVREYAREAIRGLKVRPH